MKTETKTNRVRASPLLLAVMLMAASAARARLVADGATNTLSNVTTNITGNVTVVTNGSFTLAVGISGSFIDTNAPTIPIRFYRAVSP